MAVKTTASFLPVRMSDSSTGGGPTGGAGFVSSLLERAFSLVRVGEREAGGDAAAVAILLLLELLRKRTVTRNPELCF